MKKTQWLALALSALLVAAGEVPKPNLNADSTDKKYQVHRAYVLGGEAGKGKQTIHLELTKPDAEKDWEGPTQAYFIDSVTLTKVVTDDGKALASAARISAWPSGHQLTFFEIPVGEGRKISQLAFDVNVVKVVEWEKLTFRNLKEKDNPRLRCGPFDLQVSGDQDSVHVFAAAFADTDYNPYRAKVPLKFLTHAYASQALKLTDANGTELENHGEVSAGGASSITFSTPSGLRGITMPDGSMKLETPAGFVKKKVTFPITVEIKMPAKWEAESTSFDVAMKDLD